jgi:type I restriction enzyme R subunit
MDLTGAGAKVRELIQTHITSQGIENLNPDPVSIMDEVAYEEQLEELESDQARASEMQNALQYQIRVAYDKDPIQYGSLRERLEELINDYKEGRYAEREVIEEIRTMMDEVRDRDKQARQKGLRDEVDLSFYHGVEAALSEFECDDDDILSLTKSLVEVVEEHVDTVEWDIRNHVQNTMRKDVKIALYQSGLDMNETARDELTNRVIELARANYA